MDKILYHGLSLCCYAGCIFMVTLLFVQYNDNQDSSQVTVKQFNVSLFDLCRLVIANDYCVVSVAPGDGCFVHF